MTTAQLFGLSAATPFGLSAATLDKLNSVFARHSAIDSVVIYGSRAKGNYRAGSDIDLTIKGSDIPFAELMQIEDQVDDLMLPYSVDLSQYHLLENADLIAHIDRVGVEIYARDADRNKAIAKSLARVKE
jgi:predicted nucleotidyltransferase